MIHYYNRKSGKNFHDLKGLPKIDDYTTRGDQLGREQPVCELCIKKWLEATNAQKPVPKTGQAQVNKEVTK